MSGGPHRAGGGRQHGDPLDRLGAAALTSGEVLVRITGVRDDLHLGTLRRAVSAIRGIGSVGVRTDGDVPVLEVATLRPVALASELRSALGRQVVSCVAVEGRIELTVDPGTPGPRIGRPVPRPRRGAEITSGPAALAGHMAFPPSTPHGPGGAGVHDTSPRAAGTTARRSWAATGARSADVGTDTGAAVVPTPAGEGAGLQQAVDAIASLSILTFDTDLRFVQAAGAMRDRHHDPERGLIGRRPEEIVGPDHWAQLAPGYHGALQGRTTTLQTPSADGRQQFEATFRPLVEGARIVGGTVTLLDVTEGRRDERRLEELRAVLASSFDGSPTGQALLSPEGVLMRTNAALRRLLARTDESLLGTDLRDATHPDDRGREDQLLFGVRRGDQNGYDIEKRMLRGDGVELRVHARMSAIRTREAQLRGFLVHVDDSDHWASGEA